MLEDGIVAAVKADAGCTALIAGRIYPVQGIPDNPSYPFVTYQNITSAGTEYAFDDARVKHARIQFSTWSQRYSDDVQIGEALGNLFSGFVGALPDTDETRVIFCSEEGRMDRFDSASRSIPSISEFNFEYE